MTKSPSFQFYAQDFLTGVMYLTNEEIGIYIKMLSKQWTDGKVPIKRLKFLIGSEWSDLGDELREKFKEENGFVFNERLEKERDKKKRFLEKQSENGAKGGRPPKNKKPKLNPKDTQKNPLEDEDEDDKDLEKVNKGIVGKNIKSIEVDAEIIYPFEGDDFKEQWKKWKIYKKEEFKFNYKSKHSEEAALKKLSKMARDNLDAAIRIMEESMANGWQGFFALKDMPVLNSSKSKTMQKMAQYD